MQINAITAFKLILFFVLLVILGQLLWKLWDSEMNFRAQGEGCVEEGGEIKVEGCAADGMKLKYAFVAPEGIVHFCCVLEQN